MGLLIGIPTPTGPTNYIGIPSLTESNGTLTALGYTPWTNDPRTYMGNADSLPSPWNTNTTGYHYIEVGGTNAGNGYPGDPAGSFPANADLDGAGDVIVVSDAGGSFGAVNENYIAGTPADPVIIIAADGHTPTFTGALDFGESDNLIIDGLTVSQATQNASLRLSNGDHVTARNCTITGTYTAGAGSNVGVGGGDHLLIYNCEVIGTDGTNNIDRHGCKFESGDWFFFLDCTFHDCNGDGIQVGDTQPIGDINNIFIAGCEAFRCNQTGFWAKNCTGLVVSQCHVHTQNVGSSNWGIGGQYDGDDWWFIFNKVHGCEAGVHIAGPLTTFGTNRNIIGNVIYDITDTGFDPTNSDDPTALSNRGGGSSVCNIHFNTLHGNQSAIHCPRVDECEITHNIIGDPSNGTARHIFSPNTPNGSNGVANYNYYEGSTQRIAWESTSNQTLAAFNADEGQEANGVSGTDPSFVDENNNNYRLQGGSTAVDAGGTTQAKGVAAYNTKWGIGIDVDFDNNARPINTDYDIGAFEQ